MLSCSIYTAILIIWTICLILKLKLFMKITNTVLYDLRLITSYLNWLDKIHFFHLFLIHLIQILMTGNRLQLTISSYTNCLDKIHLFLIFEIYFNRGNMTFKNIISKLVLKFWWKKWFQTEYIISSFSCSSNFASIDVLHELVGWISYFFSK